jgi:hypothetical protein
MAYKFEKLEVWQLVETVACQHLINRRQYLEDTDLLRNAYHFSEKLFAKLQAFRTSLKTKSNRKISETSALYEYDGDNPF